MQTRENMVEIIKFFYVMITFLFLFIILTDGTPTY